MATEKRSPLLLVGLLLLSLTGPASAHAACDPSVPIAKYDDESAMLGDGGGTFIQNTQWIAQSFLVPATNELGDVAIFAENMPPSGDDITLQVLSDSGGFPGAVLGQVTTSTTNTTSFDWLSFNFSSAGVQLTGGATYWIAASNTITNNGEGYEWQETFSSSAYPDGFARASNNQGASWNAPLSDDYGFRVFCAVPTPAAPGAPAPAASGPDLVPASITNYAVFPATFVAALRGPSIASASGGLGTTVSYTLSEAASLTFTVERARAGRRAKGKCRKATRKNRRAKRCDLALKGSFKHEGKAGQNSFRFTGRLSNRKLRPGSYRLVAAALDRAGNRSKPARLRFRIIRG